MARKVRRSTSEILLLPFIVVEFDGARYSNVTDATSSNPAGKS